MAERRLNVAKRREAGLPPGARWRGKSIQVLVYRGYDAATGKREYASGTAKTVEEAWRLWRKLKTQVEEQEYIPPSRQTLAQYLAEWLEKSAKPNVKPKTYERYEALVRVHIVPRLGTVRLSKLTPRHIEEMLADLKGVVSDGTRHHVYRVLHRALQVAVRWKLITRNVCDAVEPPKVDEPDMYVLSAEEADRLLKAAKGDRLYPLYLTALHTGMRLGELLGLRWQDVDLDEGVAWVRQTLEKPGLNPVFGTPKNRKARIVPLSREVVAALKSLRIEQELERAHYAQDYQDYDLVFCQPNGRPIDGRSLSRWHWKKLREKAGLPETVRFHDLRHTFVSRSLAAGANLRAVSDIVGHHDAGFTARRYAHSLHDDRKEAVEALAQYLSPSEQDEEEKE